MRKVHEALKALDAFTPHDIAYDSGEPEWERREREQAAIWAEVEP